MKVGAFLEEDSQKGHPSLLEHFGLKVRIAFQGANPVDQFPRGRFLFNSPQFPETVKCGDADINQFLV